MEAGATVPRANTHISDAVDNEESMPSHSWSTVKAETFAVRQGPNYAFHKNKGSSVESLYELRGVDLFKAKLKVDGVAESLDLPVAEFGHPTVPSLLVVNVQLPLESPRVFKGAKQDGPTLQAVFYFSLREETARALENLDTAESGVRLLAEYFGRAETEPDMRTRFKALAIVNNLEQIGMHRLITPFNGKPVLITESGSLLRGVAKKKEGVNGAITPAKVGDASGATFEREEYLELDIHVRRWNFMARKGLNKLEPKFGILNLSVAFIVEGREDTELPEQVLGCATLNALDVAKARDLDA